MSSPYREQGERPVYPEPEKPREPRGPSVRTDVDRLLESIFGPVERQIDAGLVVWLVFFTIVATLGVLMGRIAP